MKKPNQKYMVFIIKSITLILLGFTCPKSCKHENSKELGNYKVSASTSSINRSSINPINNDTICLASKYFYIADSIHIYTAKDDNWIKKELDKSKSQFIHNDSIRIDRREAILINIKNTQPYFTKDTSLYSRIELIDSTNNKSTHSYYELNNSNWELTKQTTYNFFNRKIYKVDIYYNYYETHVSELKNVYSQSIINPIFKTTIDKYLDGTTVFDTFYLTKFDSLGNFKSQIRQGRDQNGKIIVFSKANFEFNSKGLKSKVTNYDNFNGQLKNIGFSEYKYDIKNRLIRKKVTANVNNPANYVVTYKYNSFDSCIEQFYERNDDGYPYVRKQFVYNEKNQLIGYKHQNKINENDKYKTIDNRIFEYDSTNAYIIKITHEEDNKMYVELDKFGNNIEELNYSGDNIYRTKLTFDYSIPSSNIPIKYKNKGLINSFKIAIVDEYGLKYKDIKKNYSHALKTKETYKSNGQEEKLIKTTLFTYKEVDETKN